MLILSGVVLSFVVGEEGVINRAINASQKYDIAGAKEQLETLVATYVSEYFQLKYTDGDSVDDIRNFVITKLAQESKVGDYFIKIVIFRI